MLPLALGAIALLVRALRPIAIRWIDRRAQVRIALSRNETIRYIAEQRGSFTMRVDDGWSLQGREERAKPTSKADRAVPRRMASEIVDTVKRIRDQNE